MRRVRSFFPVLFALLALAAYADSVSDIVAKLTQPLAKDGSLNADANVAVKQFDTLTADQQTSALEALIDLLPPGEKKPELAVVSSALAQVIPRAKTAAVRTAAAKRLEPLTTHAETEVRNQSVFLFGRLQVPENFPIILRAATEDKVPRVRKTARNALGDVLTNTPYAMFAHQLATYGDESLYELLNDAKGPIAERVELAVPHIIEQMNDKAASFEQRWKATRLLGHTRSPQAEVALVGRLLKVQDAQSPSERPNDPQLNLRVQAAEALVILGRRSILRQTEIQDSLRFQFVTSGMDVSDSVRQAMGQLLGFTHHRDNLPVLLEVLKERDKKKIPLEVRTGAFLGLKELAKNPALAEAVGKALLPLVASDDSWEEGAALEVLENIGDSLKSPRTRALIDDEVVKARGLVGKHDENAMCRMLCDTVLNLKKWEYAPKGPHESRYNTGVFHAGESLPLAVESLQWLAILHAAPYCGDKGKELADQAKRYWDDNAEHLEASFKQNRAFGFMKDGFPQNSNAIYAEAFAAHVYRTLLRSDERDEKRRAYYTAMKEASEAQLAKTLGKVSEAGEGHPFPASVFQTHAMSSALLSGTEWPAATEELVAKMAVRPDAATVPYYPGATGADSARGSAPRSVGFYLARVQRWLTDPKIPDPRGKLLDALEAYGRRARLYAAHATREGTHGMMTVDTPADGIAPYYFWANIAYVSTAIRFLEQSGNLEGDDILRLNAVRLRHRDAVASLFAKKDGKFKSPGADTYPGGKTWGNAFAVLTLVPVLQKCGGTPAAAALGPWLTKEAVARVGKAHARPVTAPAPRVLPEKPPHSGLPR